MSTTIFSKKPKQGRHVVLALFFSLLLIVSGKRGWSADIERRLMSLVSPIHYIVDMPVEGIHWLRSSAQTQKNLLTENARLRAHQLLLESKVQRLLALKRENQQLRELNHSAKQLTAPVRVVDLLSISLNPLLNEWLIDAGQRSGVYVGQPVLDAYGVVGQVVQVAANTSKVLLLTDSRGAIPVQNARTGGRAIAVGLGRLHTLELKDIEKTADVKSNDWYISSGFGGRFPFGYPVGRVTAVDRGATKRFLTVDLRAAAHLDKSSELLLVMKQAKHANSHGVVQHRRERK